MSMSSTILVFDSQSDFISNSIRFQFTDCCSQSRPNQHRYQIFLFGGDAAGLSIATSYGASKSYSPTRNLITTFESSCDGSLLGLRFRARFEPSGRFSGFLLPLEPVWESSTPLDTTSSLRKIVVSLPQKPIRLSSCSKPCRFIISSESFQDCLSVAHFRQPWASVCEALATLKIPIITVLLLIIRCPLLDHYLLEVYLTPHSSDSPCASHVLLAIKEHLVCGANSRWFSRAQKLSL
jgi:hypothetical protein